MVKEISVIIPTYNGAKKLPTILGALLAQDLPPDEIIVVIDGSSDNTIEVLEAWKKCLPNLKIYVQNNSGRALVRNAGAKAAVGSLLIFFDDDMEPVSECIRVHVAHHKIHAGTILTGAQIEASKQKNDDIQNYRLWLRQRWTKPLQDWGVRPLPSFLLYISAANFSISKSLFIQLGGFDGRLSDAEDLDLAVRANCQKVSLYYNHQAFAWHHDYVSFPAYVKRVRQYYTAGARLAVLNPKVFESRQQNQNECFGGWKKYIYSCFRRKIWRSLPEHKVAALLPKAIRYRLFNIILTANATCHPSRHV